MDIKMEVNSQMPLNNARPKSEGMKKATREFEAFFLSQMLKVMRESGLKSGLLSGGSGEEIYTSLLDEALSKEMARKGGIGIGDLMLKQLGTKNAK